MDDSKSTWDTEQVTGCKYSRYPTAGRTFEQQTFQHQTKCALSNGEAVAEMKRSPAPLLQMVPNKYEAINACIN